MHLLGKEGVLERIRRKDPLVRIDVEAAVQEVVEQIQLPRLRLGHAGRCGLQAGSQISGRLDGGQGPDSGLRR